MLLFGKIAIVYGQSCNSSEGKAMNRLSGRKD